MMITVLLTGGGTGGHLMPALALGEELARLRPSWRVAFAGAERGVEARILPERGLPHHLLPLEPIYRRQWWKNLRWLRLLPDLIHQVNRMLEVEGPAVVIGTGGYVSGPVVWLAARKGIATAVLDLDVQPGVATRLVASSVKQIWLATPEAVHNLPRVVRGKAVVTGAPIIPPTPSRREAALTRFGLDPEMPVLVITGGSQGALAVNRAVADWIRSGGATGIQVLWATGAGSYQQFTELHRPPAVQVFPFIDPMADAWSMATYAVARAGMMTIAELCAWGIPSILIPLPTAAADHQSHNAQAMAAAGAAVHLPQGQLTPESLADTLQQLMLEGDQGAAMAAAALARGRPNAVVELAERVVGLVEGETRLAAGNSLAG